MRDRIHNLPSALLLYGRPGIGKTAFAIDLALTLLCEHSSLERRPCGECPACQWFAAGNHPDFRLLTPGAYRSGFGLNTADEVADESASATKAAESAAKSQEIRLDQVRSLGSFFSIGAHRNGRRVVVLDPAETLNTESSNAVLKVLEEPTPGLHFILVCQRPSAILPTIASRCQRLALEGPTDAQGAAWLTELAGTSLADAERAMRRCAGAPLRARQLVEPVQMAAYQLTLETISQLPDTGPLEASQGLTDVPMQQVLTIGQHWLLDVEQVRLGIAPTRFPEMATRLRALAKRTDGRRIAKACAALSQHLRLVRHPLNARLFLEDGLIDIGAAFS